MIVEFTKVLPKFQITLKEAIRDKLGVKEGDELIFVEEKEGFFVKKANRKESIFARYLPDERLILDASVRTLEDLANFDFLSTECIPVLKQIMNQRKSLLIAYEPPNKGLMEKKLIKALYHEVRNDIGVINFNAAYDLKLHDTYYEQPIIEFNLWAFNEMEHLKNSTRLAMLNDLIIFPEILDSHGAHFFDYCTTRLGRVVSSIQVLNVLPHPNMVFGQIIREATQVYDKGVPYRILLEQLANGIGYILYCGPCNGSYKLKQVTTIKVIDGEIVSNDIISYDEKTNEWHLNEV
ncbi:AbrB/MazE/SpoVT family DNA-binding domain-containing protein [Paenibacillus periandrae]|uniref:AbrB/MazE/SpoVT family DNA-binding domain-containing protein n=1 Tax=Paenibacillus periandrae TaxID=1761741 RepID=UPI001F093C1F|nr:AbrB/MazE/SpoVT family DNA-binding domain-containing protein [Paenibacillus periandrae]